MIVFFHLTAFKIVTLIIILVKGMPMFMLASFPVLFNNDNEVLKLLYTFCGVFVPIVICFGIDKVVVGKQIFCMTSPDESEVESTHFIK